MPGSDAQPPLARTGIDRAAQERADDLIERLRADPATRVVAVHGDHTLVSGASALHTLSATQVPAGRDDLSWAFLGRMPDGAGVLMVASAEDAAAPVDAAPYDATWMALRAVGGEMNAIDASLFVEAVSLARWLVGAPFCPACGERAIVRNAGWSRWCPGCGRDLFPRTDPAVIVAVASADGQKLLLGKNALWASREIYSTFAGFVEAGESLEAAIVREVREEAGITVAAMRYGGSQAWPYPRSLMLGFHAVAAPGSVAKADGEEIVAVRWFDRYELRRALEGEADFALPGTASIARHLIAEWVREGER